MPSETLSTVLTGDASSLVRAFKDTAASAATASAAAKELSDKLSLQSKTTLVSADATLAMVKADKLLRDAELELSGAAEEARRKLADEGRAAEEAAAKTDLMAIATKGAAGGFAGLATPLGAAVAAGVALSPVLLTLGAGLGGLGLAAYGAGTKSAQFKQELAPLKADVEQFQKALQPQVLTLFGQAAGVASTVLKGLEPVSAATGRALSGVLGEIDAEFKSGTWTQFFQFMAQTAAPDMKLLGGLFVDLLADIPPLLEQLQPLAVGILHVADFALKAVGSLERWHLLLPLLGASIGAIVAGPIGALVGALAGVVVEAGAAGDAASRMTTDFSKLPSGIQLAAAATVNWNQVAGDAARVTAATGYQALVAAYDNKQLQQSIYNMTVVANRAISPLLAYNAALIAQGTDAAAAAAALAKSGNAIGLNTAAQRASFSAVDTYVQDLLNTSAAATKSGQGIDAQIASIKSALPLLQSVKGGTKAYWQEVAALTGWLIKLEGQKAITESVTILGSGKWVNTGGGTGPGRPGGGAPGVPAAAAGMLVTGGIPGRDSRLIMAMPGELVVPTSMVRAGLVDHLRGSIPGFAAGGIIPDYAGNLKGLQPWAMHDQQATVAQIVNSIASAMAAQFAATLSGGGGGGFTPGAPASGSAAAAQAFARSIMPGGWSWPALLSLWNQESGWNAWAVNPTSGAYGIPQALPSAQGHPYALGDFANQVRWGIGYISGRYFNSQNAWAHEMAFNWYDQGGYLQPGMTLAYNGTGRPEPVGPAAGTTYNITINVPPTVNPREAGRQIADLLGAHIQGGGRLYPAGVTPR